MPITYVHGDLLESDCDIIAHGCNCFHSFGAGIAKQILDKYPEAFEADLKSKRGDPMKLGLFTQTLSKDGTVSIFNLYTQFKYGYPPRQVNYEAIHHSLYKMRESLLDIHVDFFKDVKIGMPKIGCGLAGGDWNIVARMIEDVFHDKEVFVYVLDKGEVQKSIEACIKIQEEIEYVRKQMLKAFKVPDGVTVGSGDETAED